jgi:hypothetical protein
MNNAKAHDYVEQCPICRKYLTFTQAKTHSCQSQYVKEILVRYYFEAPDSKDRTIIAHGHDGIMYRLVEKSSDDSYHEPRNRRKVTRTRAKHYLKGFKALR